MQNQDNVPVRGTLERDDAQVVVSNEHGTSISEQTAMRLKAGFDKLEFTSDQTHGFSEAHFSEVSLSSAGLGWTSAFVSRQRENPYDQSFEARRDPLVSFVLNGPVPFTRTVNGISLEKKFVPGTFGIVPAGAPFDARADKPLESLQLYVRQEIVEEIAIEIAKGDPERVEIIPEFGAADPLLEQLAFAIYEAAQESSPCSKHYADHLGRAFAARLVQKHSTATIQSSRPKGLSERQLQRVSEYVEANLGMELSLSDLAKVSNLSPSHFAKLFKKSTGCSPYQFLMRRRIERARHLLTSTNATIGQIAIDCGFGDQMHLTLTFKKMTGATPATFRKKHLP